VTRRRRTASSPVSEDRYPAQVSVLPVVVEYLTKRVWALKVRKCLTSPRGDGTHRSMAFMLVAVRAARREERPCGRRGARNAVAGFSASAVARASTRKRAMVRVEERRGCK